MYDIYFPTLKDVDKIMQFMHDEWKQNHILSRNKELFLHEFQDGDRITIAIATCRENGKVAGIFGYIPYNSRKIPDIAGSLWKIADFVKEPMLGLKLRNYVIKNVPHRFFAAPGTGLQTKPIYQIIDMNFNQMSQYYILNPELKSYKIALVPDNKSHELSDDAGSAENIEIELVEQPEDLTIFPFNDYDYIAPFKDFDYLKKRFFDYPAYQYDIYILKVSGEIKNIFVCRKSNHLDAFVYRIVDFYGQDKYLKEIAVYLKTLIISRGYEYADFVCLGFDDIKMNEAGFSKLDFSQDDLVIPNFFEPFVKKNTPVYCVSDKTDSLQYRQCKADGDQDRPNI